MLNKKGFTLIELMTVTVVFTVLVSIGTPAIISWVEYYRINGSISTLRADMQYAKIAAIRENEPVIVDFYSDTQYRLFVERSNPNNFIFDAGVDTLIQDQALDGSTIFDNNTFVNGRLQFNGRGLPNGAGTIDLVSRAGNRQFSVNRIGQISVAKL